MSCVLLVDVHGYLHSSINRPALPGGVLWLSDRRHGGHVWVDGECRQLHCHLIALGTELMWYYVWQLWSHMPACDTLWCMPNHMLGNCCYRTGLSSRQLQIGGVSFNYAEVTYSDVVAVYNGY